MSKFYTLALSCVLSVMLSSAVFAASVTDQINSAIVGEDIAAVEAIATANPTYNDQALQALLKYVKDGLAASPMKAEKIIQAMNAALHIGSKGIASADADTIGKLVLAIADQAASVCSSLGVAPNIDTAKADTLKAIGVVQATGGSLAELPALLAANPQLTAQYKEASSKCEGSDEAQLFQTPSFSPPVLPPSGGGGASPE